MDLDLLDPVDLDSDQAPPPVLPKPGKDNVRLQRLKKKRSKKKPGLCQTPIPFRSCLSPVNEVQTDLELDLDTKSPSPTRPDCRLGQNHGLNQNQVENHAEQFNFSLVHPVPSSLKLILDQDSKTNPGPNLGLIWSAPDPDSNKPDFYTEINSNPGYNFMRNQLQNQAFQMNPTQFGLIQNNPGFESRFNKDFSRFQKHFSPGSGPVLDQVWTRSEQKVAPLFECSGFMFDEEFTHNQNYQWNQNPQNQTLTCPTYAQHPTQASEIQYIQTLPSPYLQNNPYANDCLVPSNSGLIQSKSSPNLVQVLQKTGLDRVEPAPKTILDPNLDQTTTFLIQVQTKDLVSERPHEMNRLFDLNSGLSQVPWPKPSPKQVYQVLPEPRPSFPLLPNPLNPKENLLKPMSRPPDPPKTLTFRPAPDLVESVLSPNGLTFHRTNQVEVPAQTYTSKATFSVSMQDFTSINNGSKNQDYYRTQPKLNPDLSTSYNPGKSHIQDPGVGSEKTALHIGINQIKPEIHREKMTVDILNLGANKTWTIPESRPIPGPETKDFMKTSTNLDKCGSKTDLKVPRNLEMIRNFELEQGLVGNKAELNLNKSSVGEDFRLNKTNVDIHIHNEVLPRTNTSSTNQQQSSQSKVLQKSCTAQPPSPQKSPSETRKVVVHLQPGLSPKRPSRIQQNLDLAQNVPRNNNFQRPIAEVVYKSPTNLLDFNRGIEMSPNDMKKSNTPQVLEPGLDPQKPPQIKEISNKQDLQKPASGEQISNFYPSLQRCETKKSTKLSVKAKVEPGLNSLKHPLPEQRNYLKKPSSEILKSLEKSQNVHEAIYKPSAILTDYPYIQVFVETSPDKNPRTLELNPQNPAAEKTQNLQKSPNLNRKCIKNEAVLDKLFDMNGTEIKPSSRTGLDFVGCSQTLPKLPTFLTVPLESSLSPGLNPDSGLKSDLNPALRSVFSFSPGLTPGITKNLDPACHSPGQVRTLRTVSVLSLSPLKSASDLNPGIKTQPQIQDLRFVPVCTLSSLSPSPSPAPGLDHVLEARKSLSSLIESQMKTCLNPVQSRPKSYYGLTPTQYQAFGGIKTRTKEDPQMNENRSRPGTKPGLESGLGLKEDWSEIDQSQTESEPRIRLLELQRDFPGETLGLDQIRTTDPIYTVLNQIRTTKSVNTDLNQTERLEEDTTKSKPEKVHMIYNMTELKTTSKSGQDHIKSMVKNDDGLDWTGTKILADLDLDKTKTRLKPVKELSSVEVQIGPELETRTKPCLDQIQNNGSDYVGLDWTETKFYTNLGHDRNGLEPEKPRVRPQPELEVFAKARTTSKPDEKAGIDHERLDLDSLKRDQEPIIDLGLDHDQVPLSAVNGLGRLSSDLELDQTKFLDLAQTDFRFELCPGLSSAESSSFNIKDASKNFSTSLSPSQSIKAEHILGRPVKPIFEKLSKMHNKPDLGTETKPVLTQKPHLENKIVLKADFRPKVEISPELLRTRTTQSPLKFRPDPVQSLAPIPSPRLKRNQRRDLERQGLVQIQPGPDPDLVLFQDLQYSDASLDQSQSCLESKSQNDSNLSKENHDFVGVLDVRMSSVKPDLEPGLDQDLPSSKTESGDLSGLENDPDLIAVFLVESEEVFGKNLDESRLRTSQTEPRPGLEMGPGPGLKIGSGLQAGSVLKNGSGLGLSKPGSTFNTAGGDKEGDLGLLTTPETKPGSGTSEIGSRLGPELDSGLGTPQTRFDTELEMQETISGPDETEEFVNMIETNIGFESGFTARLESGLTTGLESRLATGLRPRLGPESGLGSVIDSGSLPQEADSEKSQSSRPKPGLGPAQSSPQIPPMKIEGKPNQVPAKSDQDRTKIRTRTKEATLITRLRLKETLMETMGKLDKILDKKGLKKKSRTHFQTETWAKTGLQDKMEIRDSQSVSNKEFKLTGKKPQKDSGLDLNQDVTKTKTRMKKSGSQPEVSLDSQMEGQKIGLEGLEELQTLDLKDQNLEGQEVDLPGLRSQGTIQDLMSYMDKMSPMTVNGILLTSKNNQDIVQDMDENFTAIKTANVQIKTETRSQTRPELDLYQEEMDSMDKTVLSGTLVKLTHSLRQDLYLDLKDNMTEVETVVVKTKTQTRQEPDGTQEVDQETLNSMGNTMVKGVQFKSMENQDLLQDQDLIKKMKELKTLKGQIKTQTKIQTGLEPEWSPETLDLEQKMELLEKKSVEITQKIVNKTLKVQNQTESNIQSKTRTLQSSMRSVTSPISSAESLAENQQPESTSSNLQMLTNESASHVFLSKTSTECSQIKTKIVPEPVPDHLSKDQVQSEETQELGTEKIGRSSAKQLLNLLEKSKIECENLESKIRTIHLSTESEKNLKIPDQLGQDQNQNQRTTLEEESTSHKSRNKKKLLLASLVNQSISKREEKGEITQDLSEDQLKSKSEDQERSKNQSKDHQSTPNPAGIQEKTGKIALLSKLGQFKDKKIPKGSVLEEEKSQKVKNQDGCEGLDQDRDSEPGPAELMEKSRFKDKSKHSPEDQQSKSSSAKQEEKLKKVVNQGGSQGQDQDSQTGPVQNQGKSGPKRSPPENQQSTSKEKQCQSKGTSTKECPPQNQDNLANNQSTITKSMSKSKGLVSKVSGWTRLKKHMVVEQVEPQFPGQALRSVTQPQPGSEHSLNLDLELQQTTPFSESSSSPKALKMWDALLFNMFSTKERIMKQIEINQNQTKNQDLNQKDPEQEPPSFVSRLPVLLYSPRFNARKLKEAAEKPISKFSTAFERALIRRKTNEDQKKDFNRRPKGFKL